MYYEFQLVYTKDQSPVNNCSAFEILHQIKQQNPELEVTQVYFEEEKNEQMQQKKPLLLSEQLKRELDEFYYWYSPRLKTLSIKETDDFRTLSFREQRLLQFLRPQLLNEPPIQLARYLDIKTLIDDVMIKPNTTYTGIGQGSDHAQLDNQQIQPKNVDRVSQCIVQFFGQPKLIGHIENLNKSKFQLKSRQVEFLKQMSKLDKHPLRKSYCLPLDISQLDFGILKIQKNIPTKTYYIIHWSTQALKNRFQSDSIENMKLYLSKQNDELWNAQIYFDIVFQKKKICHFKFQVNCRSGNQLIEVEKGNQLKKDGPFLIEKNEQEQTLSFYIRFQGQPKCYYSDPGSSPNYIDPLSRYWAPIQNITTASIPILKSEIGRINVKQTLRVIVTKEQTEQLGFLSFCQGVEQNGLLSYYSVVPFQTALYNEQRYITISMFQEECQKNLLDKRVQWQLFTCLWGKAQILTECYDDIYKKIKTLEPERAVAAIQKIIRKGNPLSQMQFLLAVESLVQDQKFKPDDTTYWVRSLIITPSGLVPDGLVEGPNIPILKGQFIQYDKKHKAKHKFEFEKLLLLVSVRDDDGKQFKYDYIQYKNSIQNQLLCNTIFREYFQKGIECCGSKFELLGFSRKQLQRNECYFVEHYVIQSASLHMYQRIVREYETDSIFELDGILKVNDFYFSEYQDDFEQKELQFRDQKTTIKIESSQYSLMDQSSSYISNFGGLREKIFPEQGQISKAALKSFSPDEDITSIRIKFESYESVLTLDPLLEGNEVVLDEKMNDPTFTQRLNVELDSSVASSNGIKLNLGGLFIVIKQGVYKPCNLKLIHILNICQFTLVDKVLGKLRNRFTQILKDFKQKMDEQKGISKKVKNGLKYLNTKEEGFRRFLLPIEKGATLMAVYDPLLRDDEVFIQYSMRNDMNETTIVKDSKVLVFRKYSLSFSHLNTFRVIKDEHKIAELRQKYLNVIVFSSKVDHGQFPFREGDQKNEFMIIWDNLLIPSIPQQREYIRYDETYNKLKFRRNNDSGLESFTIRDDDLDEFTIKSKKCLYQLHEIFCFYMTSQNIEQLQYLYTFLLACLIHKRVIEQDNLQDIPLFPKFDLKYITTFKLTRILVELDIAAIKAMLFGTCQGLIHLIDDKDIDIINIVGAQYNLNSVQQILYEIFEVNL